jgi:hypothetical protein
MWAVCLRASSSSIRGSVRDRLGLQTIRQQHPSCPEQPGRLEGVSFCLLRRFGKLTFRRVIVWYYPISVESDTDRTSNAWLELVPVHLDSICMSDHDVVSDDPWLGRTLVSSDSCELDDTQVERADVRSESTHTVAKSGDTPGLVEGQPVLDPVAEPLETESRVSHEILGTFFLVQPSSVSVIQSLWQVPAAISISTPAVKGVLTGTG